MWQKLSTLGSLDTWRLGPPTFGQDLDSQHSQHLGSLIRCLYNANASVTIRVVRTFKLLHYLSNSFLYI
jgi:hypothetical protein